MEEAADTAVCDSPKGSRTIAGLRPGDQFMGLENKVQN
jgi:hypothetical protein